MPKTIWLLVPAVILLASVAYLFSLRDTPIEEAAPEPLGWVESVPTAQGIVFSYPREFDGEYFTPQEWPPLVEKVDDPYSCSQAGGDGNDERTIDGKKYCVTEMSEGAAGSTYLTYTYTHDRGDAVLKASFTIRFPQCMNYDEPNQSACKAEQASFDPDTLAAGLIDTARLP